MNGNGAIREANQAIREANQSISGVKGRPFVNGLALQPDYRNFWGSFNAAAIDYLSMIDAEACYVPRYFKAPDLDQELLAASDGYLQYALEIPPGSFIWGLCHAAASAVLPIPVFVFQVTDVGLNHQWFSNPLPDFLVAPHTVQVSQSAMPYLLPGLYPVVSPGRFLVEFWNTSAAQLRAQMIFGCAVVAGEEVRPCR